MGLLSANRGMACVTTAPTGPAMTGFHWAMLQRPAASQAVWDQLFSVILAAVDVVVASNLARAGSGAGDTTANQAPLVMKCSAAVAGGHPHAPNEDPG